MLPSETPTPVSIFADGSRPAAAAVDDGRGVGRAGVVVDVGAVVWEPEAEGAEALEKDVEGAEEIVEFTVARILLNTLGEMRSCPSVANSPSWLSQQVVFTSLFVRGQKLPSEQPLSC